MRPGKPRSTPQTHDCRGDRSRRKLLVPLQSERKGARGTSIASMTPSSEWALATTVWGQLADRLAMKRVDENAGLPDQGEQLVSGVSVTR